MNDLKTKPMINQGRFDRAMFNLWYNLTLFFLISFFITGCFPILEEKEKGTVNAVSLCIEKNEKQSNLLSKKLIKNQCIRKHEQNKPFIYSKKNRASLYMGKDSITVNISNFENPYDDFVITSINFQAHYKDAQGFKKESSKWKSGLWIEPKSSQIRPSVSIKMPNEIKNKIYDFCIDKTEQKNCKGWNILGFKGLKIKLK